MEKKSYVSAIIVVRNEQEYIEQALLSLINQDYPKDCYEIILIDGQSSDDTPLIVERIRGKYIELYNTSFQVLENPKKILASGWNIGIREAKGEFVFRIDAHSSIGNHYISQCVETIKRVDAVCVGGTIRSISLDEKGIYVSSVLRSPFGVGNAKFRYSKTAGYVDTVAFGLYKKDIFDEVGYFDETLKRNQDIDLHSRIKKTGKKFYLEPSIEVTYYTRNTVKKMMRQGFQNGKWNIILAKKNPKALSLRHVIPCVFVLSLLFCGLVGIWIHLIRCVGFGILMLYFIVAVYFSGRQTRTPSGLLKMPFLFWFLHMSYGFGSIIGFFSKK